MLTTPNVQHHLESPFLNIPLTLILLPHDVWIDVHFASSEERMEWHLSSFKLTQSGGRLCLTWFNRSAGKLNFLLSISARSIQFFRDELVSIHLILRHVYCPSKAIPIKFSLIYSMGIPNNYKINPHLWHRHKQTNKHTQTNTHYVNTLHFGYLALTK